jgi:hypothetical protein
MVLKIELPATNWQQPSRDRPMSNGKKRTKKFDKLGAAGSDAVIQAAGVLEEELAAGIEAAKRAEERFRRERKFNSEDFTALLERFRADGHDLVDMAKSRFDALKSGETDQLTQRLLQDAHEMVDLAAHVAVQLPDVLNRLVALVPKPKEPAAPK